MIKVSNLNKYYNKGKSNGLHVINDTTIELPDTGLICILGESGSGKTTLMNTISGLDDFESGTIDVDGAVIKKYGDANQEKTRNEKFGYIFQNYYLLQERTVEYNLMLSLGLYNITDEEKEERIDYVLKAVDMWRYKKRLVSQLSGGQQQRIAIARALAKSPKVIFADEPTGNLDEANTMRTMSILKKISENCLVVVVTHEKSIADFFADRILMISDGKIIKDEQKTSHGVYNYVEDTNLYLGEYEKRELKDGNVDIEVYDNGERPNVGLRIVCDNGKIYISVEDIKNVEVLTADSEKKVLEGLRPVVEMTDVEDMDYSLNELEYAKKPKLSFKEIRAIAYGNIKAMGKKQAFLVISLLAMAVMLVLAIQDIMTILDINPEEVVRTDSHYLEITMEKNGMITETEFGNVKQRFMAMVRDDEYLYPSVVMNPQINLSYTYTGFTQLENVTTSITDYSFVPTKRLSKEELIYGRMPESGREIVVDRWVLEKYVENSKELSNIINNVKHFLNKKLTTANGIELEVVGISDTEEMNIYIEQETLAYLSPRVPSYINYSAYINQYGGSYDGTLGIGEDGNYQVLVKYSEYMANYKIYATSAHSRIISYENAVEEMEKVQGNLDWVEMMIEEDPEYGEDNYYFWLERKEQAEKILEEKTKDMLEYYGVDTYEECCKIRDDYTGYSYKKTINTGATYTVVGFYPDEFTETADVEMIVADEAVQYMMPDIMAKIGSFYIYTDNQQKTIDYISGLSAGFANMTLLATSPYDVAMEAYREGKSIKFNARIIVTITIFLVSMLILYFMMKANAVQRIGDLAVYRLIGISKASIVGLFAYENVVISTYTSLIGAVLTTLTVYLISGIPSLGMEVNYPWYAFAVTLLFLYGVNVLIGILPIRRILKLPPAQLATKYDI